MVKWDVRNRELCTRRLILVTWLLDIPCWILDIEKSLFVYSLFRNRAKGILVDLTALDFVYYFQIRTLFLQLIYLNTKNRILGINKKFKYYRAIPK